MTEDPIYCIGRDAIDEGIDLDGPVGTASTAVGSDGQPVCAEFACRTWGCWCDREPEPECIHGNHPRDCEQCPPDQPFPGECP